MITQQYARWLWWLPVLLLVQACSSDPGPATSPASSGYSAEGKASFYGSRHHGRKTASGERFDKNALTAAHKTLPFGSRVRVVNLRNRQSVVVRINDRGPYARGRIIDLSEQAARQLNMIRDGVVPVRLELLE
ncbi:septal ring lytic transglycosylase RlpA family protein [Zobellella endophytica]|uniref:septal ring lytic transglycosylase RlpA family protein n=1 Tax=Zobellella endophytica TaxID=2116700 RepID=UPI001FED17C7|nr:septal ring lytic transglycosylase RlpA family protein [Zobellella endophytica]